MEAQVSERVDSVLGQFVWYELMTTDAAAARAFYGAVVGWSFQEDTQPPLHYGMISRRDGVMVGGVLPLSPAMCEEGAFPSWVGYIATDDLDATLAEVLARGGRQYSETVEIPEGRFAMVGDPWGAAFYLMQPRSAPGSAPSRAFEMGAVGSVGWNELAAGDFDAALTFYGELFGWEPSGSMDMGALGQYQFMAREGETLGAIMPKLPEMPRPVWSHYIRVADIDAAHAAVLAHGGQVLQEPMVVPGGDYIINAVDPQGAAFALVGQRLG